MEDFNEYNPCLSDEESQDVAEKSGGSEVVNGSRNLSKYERKLARKAAKLMQTVSAQINIKLSSKPNQWVVVWGIGVANGVSKETILEYFAPKPLEARLFVDQTFVLLYFSHKDLAENLKERYHGVHFNYLQKLYVFYLDSNAEIPREDCTLLVPFTEKLPDGLQIITNFVSADEETRIMDELFVKHLEGTSLKHRTVKHFGYEFRYGTNDVDVSSPMPIKIPSFIKPVVERMVLQKAVPVEPDQLTVNQYTPGQGIPPHCDTHSCFENHIASLSLGSSIVMDFRQDGRIHSVILPPRSLLVMQGTARYGYTHGITPRKTDVIPDHENGGITVKERELRISLTFRKVRFEEAKCQCPFPTLCDSQKGKITNDNAQDLENNLVHEVYENIAEHFTETRHKPWPRIKEFVLSLNPGDRLLDVGCANGRYFGINKDILEVGNDMSLGLLVKCHEKGHEVIRANAMSLPFQDDYFEGVMSIAVLHHISTKERRIRFLQEIMRVLSPNGSALIYVWAKEQVRSTWSERQADRNNHHPPRLYPELTPYSFLRIHDRETEFPESDMLVPWVNNQIKAQTSVHHRYYHVFSRGELESLVMELTPPPKILDKYYEQGNWVVKFQKQPSGM